MSNTNQFFNPPNTGGGNSQYAFNSLYTIGSSVNLEYSTNLVDYEIQFWQQWIEGGGANQGPTIYSASDNSIDSSVVQTVDWTPQLYTFNFTYSPIFFLWVYDVSGGGSTAAFSSHYFNLTNQRTTSTTSGLPAGVTGTNTVNNGAATLTATGVGPTATNVAPGANPTGSAASSQTSSGLSTGAKAGIGIGAAIGGILVIALAIWFGFRLARKSKGKSGVNTASSPDTQYAAVAQDSKADNLYHGVYGGHGEKSAAYNNADASAVPPEHVAEPAPEPQELEVTRPVHELP